jgi:hypothetical protein
MAALRVAHAEPPEMQTPFRGGFRKGVIADESMRFRLQAVTAMHRSPERATDGMVTMLKTDRVMERKHYARLVALLSKLGRNEAQ